MVNVADEYFDLNKIMDSGQCFRIVPLEDGRVLTMSEGRIVVASQREDGSWDFDCSQKEFDSYWREYFDLDRDYEAWFKGIDSQDEYLKNAAEAGKGLRVVNQNPWETLVSFIISQRRSVPSITTCVGKLCRKFGEPIGNGEIVAWSFPGPERLASLELEDLGSCSMGYRDKYVLDAARKVVTGELDLEGLANVGDQELLDALMTVNGVGIKVANCTALYGYHRLGLFPVDVWIKRVLETHYPEGFPMENYPGYSGFLQLLMFYEARH
ncbi:MAG: DNA-3-methyladenine glycosylase family protein [Coriobacteriales bacterium]|jgi:N-glycosylase/DNA lyase